MLGSQGGMDTPELSLRNVSVEQSIHLRANSRAWLAEFVLASASLCATSTTMQSQVCGRFSKLWVLSLMFHQHRRSNDNDRI